MDRRLWVLVVLVACASGAVGAAAVGASRAASRAPATPVLKAQRFELVDSKGAVRARLSFDAEGSPGLDLLDRAAKSRVALRLYSDGRPRLDLLDADGRRRIVLALSDNGMPGLALGRGERGGLQLGCDADGKPSISLGGKDGIVRANFTEAPNGEPYLCLHDNEGHVRAHLGAAAFDDPERMGVSGPSPVSSLLLFGDTGKLVWQAPPPSASPSQLPASLGEVQHAGPFQVILTTASSRPIGRQVNLWAEISKDGRPVTNATVKVALRTAQATGPTVTLKREQEHYRGRVDLPSGGVWKAGLTVSSPDGTGLAEYIFSAAE